MSQAAETPTELIDEPLFEIVDGQRVELPPMGANEARLASRLLWRLGPYAWDRGHGEAMTEVLFRLGPDLPQRRPDLAYVSFERWPKGKVVPPGDAWDVVPDLAVEVVSPSNRAVEIIEKIRNYFEAGVRRVWVVYPNEPLVYVYDSPRSCRVVGPDGALEGEEILPGFRLPLAELFEDAGGPAA